MKLAVLLQFTRKGRCLPVCVLLLAGVCYGATKPKLEPHYKQWLERDVAYIISNEERQAFLSLSTDLERDEFIKNFWEIRNPDPGSPQNEYKDEIYKRIAYANQFLGEPGRDNGWRTDRGRTYITLGEPQQRAAYHDGRETRPMEIWFYQNVNPALPPYFYVLFYKRDITDDYRFYSPYFDGPNALTTSSFTVNDRRAAFQRIDDALGREVARTTLSLVPNEPVDIVNATSSLESDLMLSTLKTLANHPLTKQMIERNRARLADVSHRIVLEGDYLDVLTSTLRNSDGETDLHYVLRFRKPQDFTVTKSEKGYSYGVEMNAKVFDAKNKLILTQEQNLVDTLNETDFTRIKDKVFGYEGVLPLPPGKYRIEFVLTNELRKTSYRQEKDVVVPEPPTSDLRLSDVIPFSSAEQVGVKSVVLPFSMSGIKFTPALGEELTLHPGQELKIMYQIWSPASAPRDKKYKVEYTYGRPGTPGDSKTIQDQVTREQFDANGSLVNGKKIPTEGLTAGFYRVVVTVQDPATQQKVYAATNFRIFDGAPGIGAWDVFAPQIVKDFESGARDYDRATVYLAQGNQGAAEKSLARALEKDPENELARSRLAGIYYGQQRFAAVADLYSRKGVTKTVQDETVLEVAESLVKTGQTGQAISFLESALQERTPSTPLYLTLASYYDLAGNPQKAGEIREKNRALAK